MLSHAFKRTAIVLLRAAKYLPLFLAVFLFYTIVVTAVDIHHELKGSANCIICKFSQNLSCGDGAAASLFLPAPERLQTALVTECLSFYSKIFQSPVSSRAPPFPLPSVEG
jgi:hypothetical protein